METLLIKLQKLATADWQLCPPMHIQAKHQSH